MKKHKQLVYTEPARLLILIDYIDKSSYLGVLRNLRNKINYSIPRSFYHQKLIKYLITKE